MKNFMIAVLLSTGLIGSLTGVASAQGRPNDWMTDSSDAQRSGWVRNDAKISKENLAKPGFQFLWKYKVKTTTRQPVSLTVPSLLERLIGYRGFRMLGFWGGSTDVITTIDTDLGRLEWEKKLTTGAGKSPIGSISCPGGMTAGVTRPTLTIMPSLSTGGSRTGFGRSTPAKSGVGEPNAGAVTLAFVRPAPVGPPPTPAAGTAPKVNPASPPGGQFGAGPFLVHALSSDGMFHSLHLSNGQNFEAPIKFLPPNANAQGLIVMNHVAYVTTTGGCSGVDNGVWALDVESKQVKSWKGNVSGLAGPAFDASGALYIATGAGGESPNSLVALDAKTLAVKGKYSAGASEFASTPVVFGFKDKTLIAAATKDGRIHLLDSAKLDAAITTAPASSKAGDFSPGSLSSWQDNDGVRWILAAASGAVVALKVVDKNGAPSLEPGWVSRDLVSPLPPTIINGVIFAVSSGEFRPNDAKITAAARLKQSSNAVVYALDGQTGKELWNSGTAITSFARGGAISGGVGQIYLGTYDGTIHTFGFPMEH
jgi:outer membrane protein assembly factor BamB